MDVYIDNKTYKHEVYIPTRHICAYGCIHICMHTYVCCSVLQCVAVCCGMLRCVAVCCSVLQRGVLRGAALLG